MPMSPYQVYLAGSGDAPFGKLEPLAVLDDESDGAGTVQAIGPLKNLPLRLEPLRMSLRTDPHRLPNSTIRLR